MIQDARKDNIKKQISMIAQRMCADEDVDDLIHCHDMLKEIQTYIVHRMEELEARIGVRAKKKT